MVDGINMPPTGPLAAPGQAAAGARTERSPAFSLPTGDPAGAPFPASPPAEVLSDLDKAARVLHSLAAQQVELHFEVDEKTKQIRVQVRDANGRVLREIPPTRALDILAGSVNGLAVDAQG